MASMTRGDASEFRFCGLRIFGKKRGRDRQQPEARRPQAAAGKWGRVMICREGSFDRNRVVGASQIGTAISRDRSSLLIVPGGRTVSELVLPELDRAYVSGQAPKLLLGGPTQ
jgi:hypothetical protein